MDAAFRLVIEGAPDFSVHSFEIAERSHVDARATVISCFGADQSQHPVFDELLGRKATLEISSNDDSREEPRRFHGIVDSIEISSKGTTFFLVPRLIPLGDGADHRIFLEKDSVSIAEELFEEAALTFDTRITTRPSTRMQCVQAFESVLAFVRRILAEDGITLWIEHNASEDVVVLGDGVHACSEMVGGVLRYRHGGGLIENASVTDIEIVHALRHDGAAVADYDPDHPAVDQNAAAGGSRYSFFAFPGRHRSPAEGAKRAELLWEQAKSERIRLRGRTSCRHVAVGFILEITESPRDEQNGRFRVIEVSQRGSDLGAAGKDELRYEAEFVAVPVDQPMRPRRERAQGLGGLQTMTVMGPAGSEIHPDSQGRIKAKFRWNRLSADDDTASAWVRPMQPPLSGGFFLPRTGWEVLVGFMSEPVPTGDTPIELGRLVHGQAPPAESLPGQKVRSNWGTLSTPGGGKLNQLRFDDAAGAEGMHIEASKDFNERTENDKVTTVTADENHIVGQNHVNTVKLQQITTVKGAQTYSVGKNRELTTAGVLGISAANETVMVGGIRKFAVGGDYATKAGSVARVIGAAENVLAIEETNRHVTGASSIAVGGTWTEVGGASASMGVLGANTLTVAGPLSVRAADVSINGTTLTEKYAGVYQGHAGSKFTLEAPQITIKAGAAFKAKGAHVYFKATSKIEVKAGGVKITITPGSIKVKGKLDGSAASVVTTKEEVE